VKVIGRAVDKGMWFDQMGKKAQRRKKRISPKVIMRRAKRCESNLVRGRQWRKARRIRREKGGGLAFQEWTGTYQLGEKTKRKRSREDVFQRGDQPPHSVPNSKREDNTAN